MVQEKSIALVGLPGGGKSTVGKNLARRLGREFRDTDHVIEERIGSSIRVFFEKHGEQAFRDVESEVIQALCGQQGLVLATGGGAVLRASNRVALHQATHVVYLRTSPHEIFRRLKHDTQRPLLQVKDPLAKLNELHLEREPLYREVAHFVVDTGRPSMSALVNMLVMQLELAGAVPSAGRASPG